jgi:hypothetical protein
MLFDHACELWTTAACIRANSLLLQTSLTKSRHSCQNSNCSKESELAECHLDYARFGQ